MKFKTRFAPSPTGPLHLGHAYSAGLAWRLAQAEQGQFLLRFEDIDTARCRPEWEDHIIDDLAWLSINWETPPLRQSMRHGAYQSALSHLAKRGLLYACTCNRRDIENAASAPQETSGVRSGPDGPIYPGTCRYNKFEPYPFVIPNDLSIRLNLKAALSQISKQNLSLQFTEISTGHAAQENVITFSAQEAIDTIGDIVLARKQLGTSYHLSVVLDDAFQNISHVIRGQDLFEATKIHVILQKLLGLATPMYHHHPLIRDENGRRLAKRDDSRSIRQFRRDGASPQDIWAMVGLK